MNGCYKCHRPLTWRDVAYQVPAMVWAPGGPYVVCPDCTRAQTYAEQLGVTPPTCSTCGAPLTWRDVGYQVPPPPAVCTTCRVQESPTAAGQWP